MLYQQFHILAAQPKVEDADKVRTASVLHVNGLKNDSSY